MRWGPSEEQADFRSVLRAWLALPVVDPAGVGPRRRPRRVRAAVRGRGLGGQSGGLVELALAARRAGACGGAVVGVVGVGVGDCRSRAGRGPGRGGALLADGVTTALAIPSGVVPGAVVGRFRDHRHGRVRAGRRPRPQAPGAGGRRPRARRRRRAGVEIRPRALTDRTRTAADVVFSGAAGTPVSDGGGRPPGRTPACRGREAQVTAGAADAADAALTIHGAIGYTWEHDLQLYYERPRSTACRTGRRAPRTSGSRRRGSSCDLVSPLLRWTRGLRADGRPGDHP